MQKVIITALLFLSASASATTMPTGFYGKMGFGQSYRQNQDTTLNDTQSGMPLAIKDHLDFKHSNSYEIAVGYRYPQLSWLTTELALSYHSKASLDGDHVLINGSPADEKTHLHLKSTALMLSGQVDLATLFNQDNWLFHPYFGLGIGVSRNELSDLSTTLNNTSSEFKIHNTHTDFAWQGKLGVTYAATQHIILDLSYAYNDYGKATSRTAKNPTAASETLNGGSIDYRTQEVMLGMRYFF
ncbi:opacity protein-like surface antigen [Celerinatantimonas diazotrophica]|uniref:Opacity protein-like surface antigen n=2 Tax=Celerinatantimonas diazotrophica TaxID=412034 RepID=A0A4R1KH02_9GAMM|nr:opacity protein-like surface antigen [Celerinatantimonas diazotrophica]CAG9297083.1 hypothetical protein CEDIAZO_02245 [Celerinatantimonas diazotrophica]